jgi:hypothetical protein
VSLYYGKLGRCQTRVARSRREVNLCNSFQCCHGSGLAAGVGGSGFSSGQRAIFGAGRPPSPFHLRATSRDSLAPSIEAAEHALDLCNCSKNCLASTLNATISETARMPTALPYVLGGSATCVSLALETHTMANDVLSVRLIYRRVESYSFPSWCVCYIRP